MRYIKKRIELDEHEGYVITNCNWYWESPLTSENFKHPSIQVYDIAFEGEVDIVSIDDSISIDLKDDHALGFKRSYCKALRGTSSVWKLLGVRILNTGVTLLFGHKKTWQIEFLYLEPPDGYFLRVMFEQKNSEKYMLEMYRPDLSQEYDITVTEFDGEKCKRRIIFNDNLHSQLAYPHGGYFYAYVIEF